MRQLPSALVLAAVLALPTAARAGTLTPGMTRVEVDAGGDAGTALRITFTVAGPQKGPLKVGLLHGRHLRNPVTVPIGDVARGQYRAATARIALDGDDPTGRYRIGIDGPHGRVGVYRSVIVRGPDQVVLVGKSRQVTHSWYEKRTRDLGLAWADTSGGHLAVELFLRIRHPGEVETAEFRRGRKVMCRAQASPMGVRGEVADVRLTCRGPKAEAAAASDDSGGGIPVDDDSNVYEDAASSSNPASGLGHPLSLSKVLAAPGTWRVYVRTGKLLRDVVSFRVTAHGVRAALRRPGPMKAARVRRVHP